MSDAQFLTERLMIELQKSDILEVMEREKMDDILKEQGFQQSGACDNTACLVEAGKLLPVESIIGGSVGKIGRVFSIQVRMIDIKTGKLERTAKNDNSETLEKLLTIGIKNVCDTLLYRAEIVKQPKSYDSSGFVKQGNTGQFIKTNVDSLLHGYKVVFCDSFSTLSEWETYSGYWSIENSALHAVATDKNIYVRSLRKIPSECVLGFKLKSRRDYGGGIIWTYSEKEGAGICVQFFSSRGQLSVYPNYNYIHATPGKEYRYYPEYKDWNDILLCSEHDTVTVYFNSMVIHRNVGESQLRGSCFLFVGARNEAWLDDFTIYQK